MDEKLLNEVPARIRKFTKVHIAWEGYRNDENLYDDYLAHKPEHLFSYDKVYDAISTNLITFDYNDGDVGRLRSAIEPIEKLINKLAVDFRKSYSILTIEQLNKSPLEQVVKRFWKIDANERVLIVCTPHLWYPF